MGLLVKICILQYAGILVFLLVGEFSLIIVLYASPAVRYVCGRVFVLSKLIQQSLIVINTRMVYCAKYSAK